MKEAVKKSAGSSGIMTINKNIAADVEKLVQKYVNDAMQQGVDLDTLGPEQLKMIVQLNKPKTPQLISADSPEGRDISKKLMSFLDRQSGDNVVDITGKKIDTSQGIMGGKSVKELMESGQVQKGTDGLKKGQKITDRDMFKNSSLNETDAQIKTRLEAGNKKSSTNIKNNRQLTDEEIRDYELELGDSETWLNKGTFGEAEQALKNQKSYEAKLFEEYKSIGGSKRPGGPNASKKDSLPMRLTKNFEKELDVDELLAEGYSKDQAEVLFRAREKMKLGQENSPNEALLRVKEEFADKAGIDVDDFTDIDFEIDIPDYAKGGRAGYYGGGQAMVGEDLSEIGHGADALMARNMQLSPNGQATTSTGLNYLLGQDNETVRVPYSEGKNFEMYLKDKEMNDKKMYQEQLMREYLEDMRRKKVDNQKQMVAEGGRIGFAAGGGGRRAFLKMLGLAGAGVAGVKSGILGLSEGGAKKAITETVKQAAGSGGQVPPYFLNLVKKIKNLGDDASNLTTQDRQKVTKFKDYEMTEDISTGNIEILKKERGGFREDVYMSYKVDDVPIKGKKGSTKVEEYEEYTARPDQDGKMRDVQPGVPDEVVQEGSVFEDTMSEFGKAEGGRIGFSAGGGKFLLSKLGINPTSRRFLEKVFGKQKYNTMIENDPRMHRGMLEVVEMFRNKDKDGLKSYMKNFLPEMSDAEMEKFIVSSGDSAGIEGQLIRLGSGREYKNLINMKKEADQIRKLDDFDIEDVSKNAEGGRIGFSGGGILRAIIAKSAASKGLSVRDFIKATNYKGLSPEVRMYISAEEFAALKGGQKELYENFIDMAKTRKSFQEQVELGKGTPAKPLFDNLEQTMDEKSFVPKTVTSDDIAQMELMVKNRFNKGRKDNAQGGIQTMLGE